jgi:hypothetical protein
MKPAASFRVFEPAARIAGVAAGESSSCGIDVAFRVFTRRKYRRYWFDDPAVPLAVASTLRFSFAERWWIDNQTGPPNPLFAFISL